MKTLPLEPSFEEGPVKDVAVGGANTFYIPVTPQQGSVYPEGSQP